MEIYFRPVNTCVSLGIQMHGFNTLKALFNSTFIFMADLAVGLTRCAGMASLQIEVTFLASCADVDSAVTVNTERISTFLTDTPNINVSIAQFLTKARGHKVESKAQYRNHQQEALDCV